jgi:hypothetical protein
VRRNRRRDIDWEAILKLLGVLVAVAAVVVGCYFLSQVPTCEGVEPDGEIEILWPCPDGHQDGDRFNITEDQFEDREID